MAKRGPVSGRRHRSSQSEVVSEALEIRLALLTAMAVGLPVAPLVSAGSFSWTIKGRIAVGLAGIVTAGVYFGLNLFFPPKPPAS
jgi:hypothetical protein